MQRAIKLNNNNLKNLRTMKKLLKLLSKSPMTFISNTADYIVKVVRERIAGKNSYIDSITNNVETTNRQLIDELERRKEPSNKAMADLLRDNKTRAFYHMINAMLYSPIAAEAECAVAVKDIFDVYGIDIIRGGYYTQTTRTEALLSDLDKAEIATLIDAVPTLRTMLEDLRTSNSEFKAGFMDDLDNKREVDESPSASKLSPIVKDMLNNDLIPTIAAMSKIEPENYLDTYKVICDIIEEHNQSVRNYYRGDD